MSRRDRQKRRRRKQGRPLRRVVFGLLTLLLLGAIGGGIAFASWVIDVVDDTPDIAQLRAKPAGSISTVYASDGSRLGFISSDVLRTPIPGRKIPQVMKRATVAIEDKRFYKHRGVDFEGVARAAVNNVVGDSTQGGSTLTMQLVRNLYIPERRFDKDWARKIQEAKLADELEKKHSKEWILTSYLNNVPFGTVGGQTAVGVQAAARIFFDKQARNLTLAESALLAGLPQAPSQYNPFLNPEGARRRRAAVLNAMVESRYITPAEAAEANAAGLGVRSNNFYAQRREPFVFDFVKDELIRRFGADVVRAGGLRVYTSIDLRLQQAARDAIARTLYLPEDPAAAVVTIDPSNGHILTMASSAEYGAGDDGRTNYNYAAQARRQPGSTFKTMVLMAALRKGIDPDSTYYTSKPLTPGWYDGDPTYEVKTYGNTYSGSISVTRATLSSDNSVYAQLAADIGPDAVRQAAYDMGIESRLDGYLAEALGGLTHGVSPLEMANAYATIANGGIRMTPTAILRVKFPNGDVKQFGRVRRKRTFSAGEAAEARRVLEQNATSGTGTNANIGCPMAGKTGTTSDAKDAWFAGFTPRMSTVVWIGYVTPQPLIIHGAEAQGGTFPSYIWNDYMSVAHGDYCGADWPEDPGFEGSAFFGRYASTGSDEDDDYSYDGDDGSYDDGTGDDGTTDGATTDGTGGGDFNSDEYARPPQQAPETQTPSTGGEGGGAGAPTG